MEDWQPEYLDLELPDELNDVLGDMAGALHDTVRYPAVAQNLDSTPEQLLRRLLNIDLT